MPDRLIYVGKNPINPSLHINGPASRGKYIALSHCWGGQASLRLTNDTLDDFKGGILWTEIPLTFKHAIKICRLLGVDYIWIDSLCIIQDSPDDWFTQASKMCDIYSNSWVTIAADGAPNSTHGFLTDERRQMKVKRFQCPGQNRQDSEIRVRRRGSGVLRDSFSHHHWLAPPRSPLSSRGWILQESLLSPRILHYTAEELTWECSVESRCECQVRPHQFGVERPLRLMVDDLPFEDKWATLVDHFTNRSLTDQHDKLPAIAGLARQMHNATAASYWAGLWSDTFPRALLWWILDRYHSLDPVKCISRRIVPYQAPTWSWASVTGRVMLAHRETALISDLEDFTLSVVPKGIDPYGSLQSASITAKAYLALVSVSDSPGPNEEYIGYKFHATSCLALDGESLSGIIEPDVLGDGYEINLLQPHWILIIGHAANVAHGILVREAREAPNTYERVGFFNPLDYTKWTTIATRQHVTLI